jgi:hypothetical protein
MERLLCAFCAKDGISRSFAGKKYWRKHVKRAHFDQRVASKRTHGLCNAAVNLRSKFQVFLQLLS